MVRMDVSVIVCDLRAPGLRQWGYDASRDPWLRGRVGAFRMEYRTGAAILAALRRFDEPRDASHSPMCPYASVRVHFADDAAGFSYTACSNCIQFASALRMKPGRSWFHVFCTGLL